MELIFLCGWVVGILATGNTLLWKLGFTGVAITLLARVEDWRTEQGSGVPGVDGSRLAVEKCADLVAGAVPVVVLWVLYEDVLDLWWRADDPAILKSIVQYGVLPHFYDPEVWRQFTISHVTPWVQLSYGLDYYLNGFDPAGFYLHHLISYTLTAVLCFALLRQFFPAHIASLVVCLFLVSKPSLTVAQFLMTRHYLEGLGLSALSAILYVKSVKAGGRTGWSLAGAGIYMAACTAKEVYVPLVALLGFLPVGGVRTRMKALAPYILVAIAYVGWRAWMLGPDRLLAGYGNRGLASSLTPGELLRQYDELVNFSIGWYWVAVSVSLLVVGWLLWRRRRSVLWGFAFMSVVVCVVPLIPVSWMPAGRYLFLPMFFLCVVLGAGAHAADTVFRTESLKRSIALGWPLVLLFTGTLALARSNVNDIESAADNNYAVGQFLLSGGREDAVVLNPPVVPWFFNSLVWIREHVLLRGSGPKVCYDLCVCNRGSYRTGYRYENGSVTGIDLDAAAQRAECGNSAMPLSVELRYPGRTLHWVLGPRRDGGYAISAGSAGGAPDGYFYPVGSTGSIPVNLKEPMEIVVRYVSPRGEKTYSPILSVGSSDKHPNQAEAVLWRRP